MQRKVIVFGGGGQLGFELCREFKDRGWSVLRFDRQSLDIIIPEPQRARHWAGYRQVMATGESRYGHGDMLAVPALRKDGTRISLEFTIVPVRDAAGRMEGMAAILRDVTKRFEELRALRRELAGIRPQPRAGSA